jgi:ribonuclease P protein component
VEHLKRRQDFLAAANALVCARRGCVVQARNREDEGEPRIGFTVTKKLGNAVMRNRIKRRLREAVRTASGLDLKRGHDYVFIGRAATAAREFGDLVRDIVARRRSGSMRASPTRHAQAGRQKGKHVTFVATARQAATAAQGRTGSNETPGQQPEELHRCHAADAWRADGLAVLLCQAGTGKSPAAS